MECMPANVGIVSESARSSVSLCFFIAALSSRLCIATPHALSSGSCASAAGDDAMSLIGFKVPCLTLARSLLLIALLSLSALLEGGSMYCDTGLNQKNDGHVALVCQCAGSCK